MKLAREIGIRFSNLPGFSSSMVRREAQLTASAGAASSGSDINTGSAMVASSATLTPELI